MYDIKKKYSQWRVHHAWVNSFDFAPLWLVQYRMKWFIFSWWRTYSKHYHRQEAVETLKQMIKE